MKNCWTRLWASHTHPPCVRRLAIFVGVWNSHDTYQCRMNGVHCQFNSHESIFSHTECHLNFFLFYLPCRYRVDRWVSRAHGSVRSILWHVLSMSLWNDSRSSCTQCTIHTHAMIAIDDLHILIFPNVPHKILWLTAIVTALITYRKYQHYLSCYPLKCHTDCVVCGHLSVAMRRSESIE